MRFWSGIIIFMLAAALAVPAAIAENSKRVLLVVSSRDADNSKTRPRRLRTHEARWQNRKSEALLLPIFVNAR